MTSCYFIPFFRTPLPSLNHFVPDFVLSNKPLVLPYHPLANRIRIHPQLSTTLRRHGTSLQDGSAETTVQATFILHRPGTIMYEPI